MKKLDKLEMILKICNFIKGMGIESEKYENKLGIKCDPILENRPSCHI